MDFLPLWNAIVGLFKKPYKAMLALLFLSAVSLVAPAPRGDSWLESHRTLEWGCLLFAAFYLVVLLVELLIARVLLVLHFRDLPQDERRIIHSFMKWDTRTSGFISGAATAMAMVKMGILDTSEVANQNNVKAQRGESFFTIKPWIFHYFKKRGQLLELSWDPTFE